MQRTKITSERIAQVNCSNCGALHLAAVSATTETGARVAVTCPNLREAYPHMVEATVISLLKREPNFDTVSVVDQSFEKLSASIALLKE